MLKLGTEILIESLTGESTYGGRFMVLVDTTEFGIIVKYTEASKMSQRSRFFHPWQSIGRIGWNYNG